MTKQVIMFTQLLLLQVFLSVNAVPQAAQSSTYIKFSFRAVSVGTSSLGQKYLGGSHIAAAEDVAVLKTPQEKYCYFYLKDENLVYDGAVPEVPYSATLVTAYDINQVIRFDIGRFPNPHWSLIQNGAASNARLLAYAGSSDFIACPKAIVPGGDLEYVVALGSAAPGCEAIRLEAEVCGANTTVEKRQNGKDIFPNLLVPVQPANPSMAYGTVYIPEVFAAQPLEVSFPVDANAGATCELWFYLPGTPNDPGNHISSYTLSGARQFAAQLLSGQITIGTTFASRPAPVGPSYPFTLAETSSKKILSTSCSTTGQQAFEVTAIGDSYAKWFEANVAPYVGIVLKQF